MIDQVSKQSNNQDFLREKKLAKSARQFEQQFANIMVKEMRKSINSSGLTKENNGEKIFTEMLDNEYAGQMVSSGSMGLAEVMVKQIADKDSSIDSAVALEALRSEALNSFFSGSNSSFTKNSSFQPQDGGMGLSSTYDEIISKYNKNTYGQKTDSTSDLLNFKPQIRQYDAIINKASKFYGVDKILIASVIDAESAGKSNAQSKAGAKGLMQLMDPTAKELGVRNSFNPEDNIMGGTKYLSQMLTRFDGDTLKALAAYNAGPRAVEKYNGIPPYKETQKYVSKIMNKIGDNGSIK